MPPSQIEKQQFQNQSGGYVGAVVIGPRGDDVGVAVEPGGYVWLSEQEQRLTANAPRQAKDNPFVKQTRERRNEETDALEEYEVVPLVPVSDERFVPADARPVPGVQAEGAAAGQVAQAAATASEPSVPMAASVLDNPATREAQLEDEEDPAPGQVPPPSRAAAAAAAAAANAPQEPPVQPPAPPAAPPAEEHAAASPGPASEEVGAAVPPTGPAPQGEYTASEEVGTPVQASADGPESAKPLPPSGPAAPYSPGSDSELSPPPPAPLPPPAEQE